MKRNYGIVLAFLLCLTAWWYWQACHASKLLSIPVSNFLMRDTNSNVRYSFAIHKSQIQPFGTVWKTTFYPNCTIGVALSREKQFTDYYSTNSL